MTVLGWGAGLLAAILTLGPAAQAQIAASESQSVDNVVKQLGALIAATQYDRAEKLVQDRVAAGADPAADYFTLGKVYFDRQQWQRSSGFLQKSLAAKSANAEAHELLGLDWRELHRPDDAEGELMEAARENPANSEYAYLAGHQLLLNGKSESALPYLYRAAGSEALQPQAFEAMGLAQAHLGNFGLAESYCRKAIAALQVSGSDEYPALVDLSVLLLLGHDPVRVDEGLRQAQRAEKLRPDSADANYLVGKALFKLGRFQEAARVLAQSAKLNPEDGKPHFLLARIFDELGQPGQAQKERAKLAAFQKQSGGSGIARANTLPVASE